jgi:predicted RNA-binding Zn-ribbon protein involved in translation (DUF1610 family)
MANKRNDNFDVDFGTCAKDGARLHCYDSRAKPSHRWRRYECPECGERSTTREISVGEYKELNER